MTIRIQTGTLFSVNRGLWKSNIKVMYCGMPTDSTFVLAPLIAENVGYRGYSPSIYYSVESAVIQMMEIELIIHEIHPDYIVLKIG